MTKKIFDKTRIELYELPELLKKGKAFKALSMVTSKEHQQYVSKYNRKIYAIMNEQLGEMAKKSDTYRKWFTNPEKHINAAYLINERKDHQKWLIYVNAMYFALSQVLMEASEDTRKMLAFYKERDKALSEQLNIYHEQNTKK
jgi:hypothetical protein